MPNEWFPIQHRHSPHGERFRIPWRIAEKAYKHYCKLFGTSQSLETLSARGGFGLLELIMLLAEDEFFPQSVWPQKTDFHNRFPEEVKEDG